MDYIHRHLVIGLTYRHGDFNITFRENGATVTDGLKTEEITFDFPLVYQGATIEISRIGDELTLAFVNANAPLSAIDENIYTVKGLQFAKMSKIEILGDTGVSLSKIALFNLDSVATISARNFDATKDIMQPWVTRESLQGKPVETDSSGKIIWGVVIGGVAVLCLIPLVWVLVKRRRKKCKKD